MIFKSAVENWLNRELPSLAAYKDLTAREIDELIIKSRAHFHTQPYHHQRVCWYLATHLNSLLLLLFPGLGKTWITLNAIKHRIARGKAERALVLVPTNVLQYGWKEEAAIHTPDLQVSVMTGNKQARIEKVLGTSDVLVATYQGWSSMVCDKKGNKMVVNNKLLARYGGQFQIVAYDECTALKNIHSLWFKIARRMLKIAKYRYGLTGTPFGRDPQALWGQFYVLDAGETLGETLGMMRSAFFEAKEGWFGGYDYKFKHDMAPKLREMMDNRAIHYEETECLDLPEKVFKTIRVPLPESIDTYYQRVVDELKAADGNMEEMKNVYHRMRMLTSGYLSTVDTETGEKVYSELEDNPKLDALLELLEEIPAVRKVVVFNDYVHTGDLLSRALKAAKIKHARVYSGTKNKASQIDRFKTDPNVRVILLNNQSGAMGLNLQVANYVAFFESPSSPIIRTQAIKRVNRSGQTRTCFYFDLAVRGTIDEKILRYLEEGQDLFQALLGNPQKTEKQLELF